MIDTGLEQKINKYSENKQNARNENAENGIEYAKIQSAQTETKIETAMNRVRETEQLFSHENEEKSFCKQVSSFFSSRKSIWPTSAWQMRRMQFNAMM